MEEILTKVKGRKLQDCPTLAEAVQQALEIVRTHCWPAFSKSWQSVEYLQYRPVEEQSFFENYLWCVYVSGFSAQVVTKRFDELKRAHAICVDGQFIPSSVGRLPSKEDVFKVWKNQAKYRAIHDTRGLAKSMGWRNFHRSFVSSRSPYDLQKLAFMGPALSRHLARNLGNVGIVKPDVHLMRLAKKFVEPLEPEWWETGLDPAERLCQRVKDLHSDLKGWPLGKIDLLLWYAMASTRS